MKWISYLLLKSFRDKQAKYCKLPGKLDDSDVKAINIKQFYWTKIRQKYYTVRDLSKKKYIYICRYIHIYSQPSIISIVVEDVNLSVVQQRVKYILHGEEECVHQDFNG